MPAPLLDLASRIARLGSLAEDSEEVRLRKSILVSSSLLVILATAAWGLVYLAYGELLAACIPFFYVLATSLTLISFSLTRREGLFLFGQLMMGLVLPFLLGLALGGFAPSSGVVLWSAISPIGALLLVNLRSAVRLWLAYFALLALSGLLEPYLRQGNGLPPRLAATFFVLNIGAVSTLAIAMIGYFIQQKEKTLRLLRIEEEKAENLLLNILPREIAAILKNENRTIADHFDGASILFADLVGFTPLTAELPPVEVVDLLNEIFSHFDALVEKYDLEKIRTIGDNYMVAAGAPRPLRDHACLIARLALEMSQYLHSRPSSNGRRVEFRIGINSGSVVGGVIGRKKFVYDLWGDAVNVASRMESQGVPGRIQITRATYELIAGDFICEPRGRVRLKGRGEMETWFLLGEKPGRSPAQDLTVLR